MHTRIANFDDYQQLGEVMFDAVHCDASLYSEAQRLAWVDRPRHGEEWNKRLAGQSIIVAEIASQIVGFISLAPHGYIDFSYVRSDQHRRGILRRLYSELESLALKVNEARLWVHASLMAQPAFSKFGFVILERETVEVRGEYLDRFLMEKKLGPGGF